MEQYGRVNRTEMISDSCSEFEGSLIIEFNSGTTIVDLRNILPYTFSSSDKTETCLISELSTVYAEYIAKSKTQSYLTELQNVAKLFGMDFAEVLKTTMAQIGRSPSSAFPRALRFHSRRVPGVASPPPLPDSCSPQSAASWPAERCRACRDAEKAFRKLR